MSSFWFDPAMIYSPSLWHGFCPVKRTGKYFAKKWSEQKVVGIEVVGLYITYQKYKRIDGPSSYQFRENWTWVFSQKTFKSLSIFSPKIRSFLGGQTWTVGTSNHPSNHPWKKNWGLLTKILNYGLKCPKKSYFLYYEGAIFLTPSFFAKSLYCLSIAPHITGSIHPWLQIVMAG